MSRERTFLDPSVIVDAALEIIVAEGVEALTTRKLAARLGVSVMTLYNYYKNREAILKEAIFKGFEILKKGFPERIAPYLSDPDKNPLRLFLVVADQLLKFALEHPRLFEFLFQADLQPQQNDSRVAAVYSYSYSHIRARIIDQGREEDIHRKIYIYEVLMGGLVRNVLKGRGNMTPDLYAVLMSEAYDSLLKPIEPLIRSGPAT